MTKVVDFQVKSTIEHQAAEWLIRLDGDDPLTPEEHEKLRLWLDASAAHREQLNRLAELWNGMNVLTELAVPLDQGDGFAPARQSRWRKYCRPFAVAATIVVAATVLAVTLIDGESMFDSNGLYATAVGQQRTILLSDGSTVLLNTDSQIRVNFISEFRDIYLLQGEAHFSVERNSRMPFRVVAGSGRVRAIGTAFSVRVREDDGAVDVTVSEGSVAVEAFSSANTQRRADVLPRAPAAEPAVRDLGTLRAGQIATILRVVGEESDQAEVLSNVGSVESPEIERRLAWTEGVLIFSGDPLEEVVREISRYTTSLIEFSDPDVAAIRVGGRFPVGETETMFETLEETFGLRVIYLSDNHVLVSAGD